MARTNLPLSALTKDGAIAKPAGTNIDQANGMNVALASTAIPHAQVARNLWFEVANTGTTGNFILRAGVNPPSFRKDLGDFTTSITNSTTKVCGPFDASRYMQSDGSLNVDFASGFTGTIIAYVLPPTA